MIHKFHTEQGEAHPVLSERRDIIVITDEVHRSQYDSLALKHAHGPAQRWFLSLYRHATDVGEEKTRQVIGEYISVYDFQQSVADGATVPLYYENRDVRPLFGSFMMACVLPKLRERYGDKLTRFKLWENLPHYERVEVVPQKLGSSSISVYS